MITVFDRIHEPIGCCQVASVEGTLEVLSSKENEPLGFRTALDPRRSAVSLHFEPVRIEPGGTFVFSANAATGEKIASVLLLQSDHSKTDLVVFPGPPVIRNASRGFEITSVSEGHSQTRMTALKPAVIHVGTVRSSSPRWLSSLHVDYDESSGFFSVAIGCPRAAVTLSSDPSESILFEFLRFRYPAPDHSSRPTHVDVIATKVDALRLYGEDAETLVATR